MNVRLPPLPYELDSLEPHLSRRTLAQHHGTHHRGYVDRTRRLIENTRREYAPLEVVVRESAAAGERQLFGVAAQAWNHKFYWSSMDPAGGGEANGSLAPLIESSFGTQSAFQHQFVAAALESADSGWVWLVAEGERLRIVTTPIEDTALVLGGTPLLTVEISEHAYQGDYQSRRADYVSTFLTHLVNWKFANRNLEKGRFRARRAPMLWGTPVPAQSRQPAVRSAESRQPAVRSGSPELALHSH